MDFRSPILIRHIAIGGSALAFLSVAMAAPFVAPSLPAEEIVFAVRTPGVDGHWYANFSYYADGPETTTYGSRGGLCVWNTRTGALRKLLDDPEGAVRDPVVHYDARKILFSYRPGGTEVFHLYEINPDGSGLRQLTDGIYDDIEPCYLPDGGIAFISARARRWVNCWLTQVATVHRCDADGHHIQMLSANIEHDNTPWPMPDGRLLYTRWEYVDRNQINFHHLWVMNPDGTSHQVFFGNMHPGGLFIDARPVPDSDEILFIDSPGHGIREHQGFVALVNPKRGPDDRDSLRRITRTNAYRDPWPFSRDAFLAAKGRHLVMLNREGRESIVFTLPDEFGKDAILHEPRPLLARHREPVLPVRTDPSKAHGKFLLDNVYYGRNLVGVPRGTIRKLLILESLPKPINYTGGMDPLSYGGTFTLPRVLGTVPVEEDGSAYFEAPALRALFFVALDANGRSVKRMQSFTQLMPGELQGCTGCHEYRTSSRPMTGARTPQAALRAPSIIDAADRMFDVPDFPRHIQPILDRHCVRCHNPAERKGGIVLTGDHGPMFSFGYYTLVAWRQVADGRNKTDSNRPPYALGSGGSVLMKKVDGTHHDARPSPDEVRTLALWLDASAPYPGTYAALGTGMIGGYQKNRQREHGPAFVEATKAAVAVFQKRCAQCHNPQKHPIARTLSDENGLSFWQPELTDPRLKANRHVLFNLTHPDQSLFLLAPLAKDAGGYGLCAQTVFTSKENPEFQILRAMIDAGHQELSTIKRFDMPGFRPRPEYLREMKRYGILPPDFDMEKDPVDPYETDRKYWDSFIYRPPAK